MPGVVRAFFLSNIPFIICFTSFLHPHLPFFARVLRLALIFAAAFTCNPGKKRTFNDAHSNGPHGTQ
jgi:hypothetical protein